MISLGRLLQPPWVNSRLSLSPKNAGRRSPNSSRTGLSRDCKRVTSIMFSMLLSWVNWCICRSLALTVLMVVVISVNDPMLMSANIDSAIRTSNNVKPGWLFIGVFRDRFFLHWPFLHWPFLNVLFLDKLFLHWLFLARHFLAGLFIGISQR